MGNCQAVDAAALVIQHPSGKIERLYSSITATDVMKMHPGHYVSLIIPLPSENENEEKPETVNKSIRFSRVKLLRPSDSLVLGRAYRLVTTQEVEKVLRAKKDAKIKKRLGSDENLQTGLEKKSSKGEERHRQIQVSRDVTVGSSKTWRPYPSFLADEDHSYIVSKMFFLAFVDVKSNNCKS